MDKRSVSKQNNWELVICIIILIAFGMIMIYSASSYTAQISFGDPGYFVKSQARNALIGIVLMIILDRFIPYGFLCNISELGYLVSLVLAALTLFVGREINGTKRWLGIGGLSFQPSEVVKAVLIVYLAVIIVQAGKKINTVKGWLLVWAWVVPAVVLVGATSLTSGIVIALIAATMTFVATKIRAPYIVAAVVAVLFLIFRKFFVNIIVSAGIFKPYQLSRLVVWIEPEAHPLDGGYQVLQGLYAIGSGGVFGKGLGQSIQKLGFIPEAQNDMIFTIICEELGFLGALFVIALYAFIIFKIIAIAKTVRERKGKLICIGVAAHIAIQAILNIAVACNVIPNTGVTLPFLSCGGTSIIFLLAEIGIVLNISRSIVNEPVKERP